MSAPFELVPVEKHFTEIHGKFTESRRDKKYSTFLGGTLFSSMPAHPAFAEAIRRAGRRSASAFDSPRRTGRHTGVALCVIFTSSSRTH